VKTFVPENKRKNRFLVAALLGMTTFREE